MSAMLISSQSILLLQVGGGTFALRGDLWVQNTFDINPGRDLTVRSGLPYHFADMHFCEILLLHLQHQLNSQMDLTFSYLDVQ